jgi:hypothetical protein
MGRAANAAGVPHHERRGSAPTVPVRWRRLKPRRSARVSAGLSCEARRWVRVLADTGDCERRQQIFNGRRWLETGAFVRRDRTYAISNSVRKRDEISPWTRKISAAGDYVALSSLPRGGPAFVHQHVAVRPFEPSAPAPTSLGAPLAGPRAGHDRTDAPRAMSAKSDRPRVCRACGGSRAARSRS